MGVCLWDKNLIILYGKTVGGGGGFEKCGDCLCGSRGKGCGDGTRWESGGWGSE